MAEKILNREGLGGFYRGFLPNALKNLPNKGVLVARLVVGILPVKAVNSGGKFVHSVHTRHIIVKCGGSRAKHVLTFTSQHQQMLLLLA